MSNYMNEMRPQDIVNGKFKKVIFGVGSTENHGDHMPIGTDNLIAHGLAKRIADAFDDILLLPAIPYSFSTYHQDFPFTLYVQAETITQYLEDLLDAIVFRGIKQIIIINGHDGNIAPIEIAGRYCKMKYPDVSILSLPVWWGTMDKILPEGTFSDFAHGHGGEAETSLMMAFRPDLVDLKLAKPMIPKLEEDLVMEMKVNFSEFSTIGSTGHPELATPEKAKMLADTLVKYAVNYITYLNGIDWKYAVEK